MSFGTVNSHVNALYSFNTSEQLVFNNSEHQDTGIFFAADNSGSMAHHLNEIKMALSAAGAVSNNVGAFKLPAPGGGTAMIDCVSKVYNLMTPAQREHGSLVVLTDGMDNQSKAWQHTGTGAELVPQALSKLEELCPGVHIVLMGVGDATRDVVRIASQAGRRIVPVHIPRGSTARDVTTVVRTAVRAPRRAPPPGAPADAPTAPINVIVVDAPECADHAPTDEEVAVVTEAAGTIEVAAPAAAAPTAPAPPAEFTADELKAIWAKAETATTVGTTDKKLARTAQLWLIKTSMEKGVPMAGALLGGKRGHLFVDPAYPEKSGWEQYHNMMLGKLKNEDVLIGHKNQAAAYDIEGRYFNFHGIVTYEPGPKLTKKVLDELLADTEWCPAITELAKVAKGNSSAEKIGAVVTVGTKRKAPDTPPEEQPASAAGSSGAASPEAEPAAASPEAAAVAVA